MTCGDTEINPGLKFSSIKCFLIPYDISAQSYAKVSLLTAYDVIYNFDVPCGSETFLNPGIQANDANLEILGYNTFCVVRAFYNVTLPLTH